MHAESIGRAEVPVKVAEEPPVGVGAVSYTHLDVYKRQAQGWQCVLRTDGEIPETLKDHVCYIADTTGELRLSLIHI